LLYKIYYNRGSHSHGSGNSSKFEKISDIFGREFERYVLKFENQGNNEGASILKILFIFELDNIRL